MADLTPDEVLRDLAEYNPGPDEDGYVMLVGGIEISSCRLLDDLARQLLECRARIHKVVCEKQRSDMGMSVDVSLDLAIGDAARHCLPEHATPQRRPN